MTLLPAFRFVLGALLATGLGACTAVDDRPGPGGGGGTGPGNGPSGGAPSGNAATATTSSVASGGGSTSSAGGDPQLGDAIVNWLDPLDYPKPRGVAIALPDEATCPNRYFVDLDGGSGSACTEADPCGSFEDLVGLPGIAGGPAYVYARGEGSLFLYEDVFHGAPGQEIVIKPWGDATAEFRTSFGPQSIEGDDVHDLVIDGGPDLAFTFVADTHDQNSLHVRADRITLYRTQHRSTEAAGGATLIDACSFRVCRGVRIVNNEFHSCNFAAGHQCSAVYFGGGADGGYVDAVFQNNVVRQMGGEGIEVNPRVTSSGIEISGNAIHDVGKQTCFGSWRCRPGITMSVQSGDGNNATVIVNNFIWDTGASCIWDRGGGSPAPLIANNTCYGFAHGDGASDRAGISGYGNGGTAIVRNNILLDDSGAPPFDGSSFVASHNACLGGNGCGESAVAVATDAFVSLEPASSGFLRLAPGSPARDVGLDVADVADDYFGRARLAGAYDIGAEEAE